MPNPIYWMLVDSHLATLEAPEVLSPFELQKYCSFRFPKRRDEWLLGRRTAKALAHSLPTYQHYSLAQIEIRNAPEGSPYLQLPERAAPAECLTISHSGNLALCALSIGLKLHIGADLEKIEARTETFILDYFTPTERQLVDRVSAETRAEVVTLIWSVKESMLKALGTGLRRDTRSVEVLGLEGGLPSGDGHSKWQMIQVQEQPTSKLAWAAWWQRRNAFILTLAGFAATQEEIQSTQLVEQQVED
jgi:4'-phosphopantetheinyl transferase